MTDAELESLGRAEAKRLSMELRHDPDGGYGWADDMPAAVDEHFDGLWLFYDDPAEAFRDFGEFIAGCRAACGFDAIRDATLEEAAGVAQSVIDRHDEVWDDDTHQAVPGAFDRDRHRSMCECYGITSIEELRDAIRAKKGAAK